MLEAIADFYNVDIDYLYGMTDTRKKVHINEDGKPFYYIDEETADIAQEMYLNDHILFDVYRTADRDRLVKFAKKLDELRKLENEDK